MQKPNSKTIRTVAIVALLILAAASLRMPWAWEVPALPGRSASILRSLINFGLLIAWGVSIRRRVMQRQAQSYLLTIAALMVFWLMVRTVKYFFIIDSPDATRTLWYAFYIPLLLIPLIGVFVALSLGRPEEYRLPKWTQLLYIPTLLLLGLVLTNDLHQLVFAFPTDAVWDGSVYRHHTGYFLVFAWIILCALTTLAVLLSKSRVPRSRKVLWLPFVPLLFAVVYVVMYVLRFPIIKIIAGDMTVVLCLLIAAIFESCIQVGLIRSNQNYEGLFFAAGIAARIVDSDYAVRYSAGNARPLSEETMRRAASAPVELDENTRLLSVPITGGHALWLEDVSEMNRLLSELGEVGETLSENNVLLEAELELKERAARVEEKNRLYDAITREAAPQLRTLDDLLSDDSAGAMPAREKLMWLCILGTYLKRRSNLIILSEDAASLPVKELEYCFRESAEAISVCGIDCSLKRQCEGFLPADDMVLLYDLLEEIVEAALPTLTALFIWIHTKDGAAEIKLQVSGAAGGISLETLKSLPQLHLRGGQMTETTEDDTLRILLRLPKGGARP